MSVKVLIYEDNDNLRETLAQVLGSSPDITVLETFPDCRDIKHHIEIYQPDVLLMDIDMPFVNGIEGAGIVKLHFPKVEILMLTVFEEEDKIFDALCAGAGGYLLKQSDPDQIIDAVLLVAKGGVPMTPQIARKVLGFFPNKPVADEQAMHNLSARELEILNCLVKGLSYKMIAAELLISIDTVRTHIKKIYDKLHVNSATEAVSKALQQKIIK